MVIEWNKFSEVKPPKFGNYYVTLRAGDMPDAYRWVSKLCYNPETGFFKQVVGRKFLDTNQNVIAWAVIEDIEPYEGE